MGARSLLCAVVCFAASGASAPESIGNPQQTRAMLAAAVRAQPRSIDALRAYGEFLERYGDPESRAVYRRLLRASGDSAGSAEIARRLARLDLLAGETDAAAQDFASAGLSAALFTQGKRRPRRSAASRYCHSRPDAFLAAWPDRRAICSPRKFYRRWRATSSRVDSNRAQINRCSPPNT